MHQQKGREDKREIVYIVIYFFFLKMIGKKIAF